MEEAVVEVEEDVVFHVPYDWEHKKTSEKRKYVSQICQDETGKLL